MADIFGFLFLASFLCLVIGLITPSAFRRVFPNNFSRKRIAKVFGLSAVCFFLLVGLTHERKQTDQADLSYKPQSITPATPASDTTTAKSNSPKIHGIPEEMDFLLNKNTVLVAYRETMLTKHKYILEMLILSAEQKDRDAVRDVMGRSLANGTLEVFPEGSNAYFIKGVNKRLMLVRPRGIGEFYYAFRESFDKLPDSPDGKK